MYVYVIFLDHVYVYIIAKDRAPSTVACPGSPSLPVPRLGWGYRCFKRTIMEYRTSLLLDLSLTYTHWLIRLFSVHLPETLLFVVLYLTIHPLRTSTYYINNHSYERLRYIQTYCHKILFHERLQLFIPSSSPSPIPHPPQKKKKLPPTYNNTGA